MKIPYNTYSIGGIDITVDGGETRSAVVTTLGFSKFLYPTPFDSDYHIYTDTELWLPECRWLHRFDILDDTAECRFGIDDKGNYWFAFGDEGLLCYRQPQEVFINTITDPDLLRFVMWTAYSLIALPLRATPIHSSVVVCDGRAVLCLGESGTGKSTHTDLWVKHIESCCILNDDSPILRFENGKAVVYGSPWSGKRPFFNREHYPVAAMVRIEQRPENVIRRLTKLEAFTAVHPSCPPALSHDEHMLDLMVDLVGHIILDVPVYRLGCLPDKEAAQLCHDTIFADS